MTVVLFPVYFQPTTERIFILQPFYNQKFEGLQSSQHNSVCLRACVRACMRAWLYVEVKVCFYIAQSLDRSKRFTLHSLTNLFIRA